MATSPLFPFRFLRKLRKAVLISFYVRNFLRIWWHVVLGKPVNEIQLWNGWVVHAPHTVQMWNHFNDIWLNAVYTRFGLVLPKGGVVVDIGANIGLFSLLAARTAARIVAVEPSPETFKWLTRNLAQCGLDNIFTINAACANTSEERPLFIHSQWTSNSLQARGVEGHVMVSCVTLEELLDKYCEGKCDFLKMDCEGAEYEILLGASNAQLQRVGMIAMECHVDICGRTAQDLGARLTDAGFSVTVERVHEEDDCVMLYAHQCGA